MKLSRTSLLSFFQGSGKMSDNNGCLSNTRTALIQIPDLDSDTTIGIQIINPSFEGLPPGVTTTPPLFIDDTNPSIFGTFPDDCEDREQWMELSGTLSQLPYGYTYQPFHFEKVKKGTPKDSLWIRKNEGKWKTSAGQGNVELLGENRKVTLDRIGFYLDCPYVGYDPEDTRRPLSAVYDHFKNNVDKSTLADGYLSSKPHPILLPPKLYSHDYVSAIINNSAKMKFGADVFVREKSDFLVNCEIVLEIVRRKRPMQRVLCFVKSVSGAGANELSTRHSTPDVKTAGKSEGSIVVGGSLNLYIEGHAGEWRCVSLHIVDVDHKDGTFRRDFSCRLRQSQI